VDRDDPAYKKRASINLAKSFFTRQGVAFAKPWNQVWKADGSAHSTHHTKDNDNKAAGAQRRIVDFVSSRLTKRKSAKCLDMAEDIIIAKRPVRVAHSENKTAYDSKKNRVKRQEKEGEKDRGTKRAVEEEEDIDDDDSDSDQDDEASDDSDMEEASDDESESSEDDEEDDEEKRAVKELERATEGGECGDNACP
jgi:hypothetical protein